MDSLDKNTGDDIVDTSADSKQQAIIAGKSDISDTLRDQPEIISLEEENFRIDSESSLYEWKQERVGPHITVKYVKIPGAQEDAYVYEYVRGVKPELIGQQLFTWAAVVNLGIEENLPTQEEFVKMKHGDFFRQYDIPYAGFRGPDHRNLKNACFRQDNHQACFRLKGGENVSLREDGFAQYGKGNMKYAYSLRLKKK